MRIGSMRTTLDVKQIGAKVKHVEALVTDVDVTGTVSDVVRHDRNDKSEPRLADLRVYGNVRIKTATSEVIGGIRFVMPAERRIRVSRTSFVAIPVPPKTWK